MKDAAAIVGIAESEYTKWGKLTLCTEYQLALETILRAVNDAGLTIADVDGFASFSNDRNEFCFVATDLGDRKSTRLNSSHGYISYAVFCLKNKNKPHHVNQNDSHDDQLRLPIWATTQR